MSVNKIFYTNPLNPNRVALIVTNRTVQQLKEKMIIKQGDRYLINPEEKELMTLRIECVKFDDKDNPTSLVFDVDTIREIYITEIRKKRSEVFSILDYIQQRAISLNKLDAAALIEADKQALRDLTSSVDYSRITEIRHIYTRFPSILFIDYKDKYSYV